MKKISAIAMACTLLFSFAVFGNAATIGESARLNLVSSYTKDLAGTQLNVCNWGEYISDGSEGSLNVIKAFEDATGITVNYTNFDTNEGLYAKMAGGGANYDVIIPSDYMIQRMAAEDLLQPLDFSKIPNEHFIMDEYQNLYYDPDGKFSVPYTIGMVGLIYNTTLVDEPPASWQAMWDPQYKGEILQFASPRDAFGTAQYLLGQDINSTNEADWQAAAAKLKEQALLVQSYVADEIYNIMEGGNAVMGPYYAGDFLMMHGNNEDLGFVYPGEGTNFFYDSACIPKAAQHAEAAHMFINFLLEPDIALANAEFIMYATPHKAVRENPDYSLKDNEILYPETLPKVQSFENLPQNVLNLMNNLWTEVKQTDGSAGQSSPNGGGIPKAVLIAVPILLILLAVYLIVKKIGKGKKRAI